MSDEEEISTCPQCGRELGFSNFCPTHGDISRFREDHQPSAYREFKAEKERTQIVEEPSREELEKTLQEERRRHWLEEEKARQAGRYQYDRAEELEKEKRRKEKKEEFEKRYGKVVAVINPPFREEKVISPNDEHEERSALAFREPPSKKTRYKTYRRKGAGE